MPKTIKTILATMLQRVKIIMLRNDIKKASKASYMSLYERIELRNRIALLNNLEQQSHAH